MNKLIIFGILGQDAQVANPTANGSIPIKFSVAVSEKRGDTTHTDWFSCTKWVQPGGSTKIADYLKKGGRVCVSGRVTASAYTDKSGKACASLEVNVQDITLGGSSEGTAQRQAEPAAQDNEPFQVPDNQDDLPF